MSHPGTGEIHAQHQPFLLPEFQDHASLRHRNEASDAGNFQGGCRGSHKSAPHLPSNIPVFLPGWEQMRWPECLTGWEELQQCPSLCHSTKEFIHKGQVAAAAHTGCSGAAEKGEFIRGLLNPQPLCRAGGVLRAGQRSARSCGKPEFPVQPLPTGLGTALEAPVIHFPSQGNPKATETLLFWAAQSRETASVQPQSSLKLFTFHCHYPNISFKVLHSHHLYRRRIGGTTGNNEVCRTRQAAEEDLVVLNSLGLRIRLILHAWLHQHVELCNVASCRTVQSMTYHLIGAWN